MQTRCRCAASAPASPAGHVPCDWARSAGVFQDPQIGCKSHLWSASVSPLGLPGPALLAYPRICPDGSKPTDCPGYVRSDPEMLACELVESESDRFGHLRCGSPERQAGNPTVEAPHVERMLQFRDSARREQALKRQRAGSEARGSLMLPRAHHAGEQKQFRGICHRSEEDACPSLTSTWACEFRSLEHRGGASAVLGPCDKLAGSRDPAARDNRNDRGVQASVLCRPSPNGSPFRPGEQRSLSPPVRCHDARQLRPAQLGQTNPRVSLRMQVAVRGGLGPSARAPTGTPGAIREATVSPLREVPMAKRG